MLSLFLLQHVLTPGISDAHARSRLPANPDGNSVSDAESRPYLKIAGLLPLRIKTVPPPPDLISKPPAGAPPQPVPNPTAEASPTSARAAADADAKPGEPASPATPNPVKFTSEATRPALPILPDDTHPTTRPEDFLPFFQFPVPNRNGDVVVPVAAPRPSDQNPLPPSSATYQQK